MSLRFSIFVAEICNVYRCQVIRFPDLNEYDILRLRHFIEIKYVVPRVTGRTKLNNPLREITNSMLIDRRSISPGIF